MAFFRINKNLLADAPTFGALQKAFRTLEEIKPISSTEEHPQFKWFRVTGPGIPEDNSIEIELQFELVSSTKVNIRWQLKHQL